jgi:hypothetical protein
MEIEEKFRRFNLTDEMAENFRYLANVSKGSNEQSQNYIIKTIVFGEHEVHSNKQGEDNAKLG